MKEIKQIIAAYENIDFNTQQAALATVVRVEGSSYRRMGARMLVLNNGVLTGGISGGCLEGDALRRAQQAIFQQKSSLITYDTTQDDAHQIGVALGCNGIIDVLFTPLDPKNDENSVKILKKYIDRRDIQILLTVSKTQGSVPFRLGQVFQPSQLDAQFLALLQPDIDNALQRQQSAIKAYILDEKNSVSFFIEVLFPEIHLVIYGGNYDVIPMLRLSKELGWRTSVVTNIHKANKTFFELANTVMDKGNIVTADAFTACLLVSHDYNTDKNNLQKISNENIAYRYVGMLGPRKRTEKILHELEEQGVKVHKHIIFAPIGLDIGANSPEEIALSIIAEIQAYFTGRKAGFLREKKGAIHE